MIQVGTTYVDHDGRRALRVTKVDPGDPLGRQVQGTLSIDGKEVRDYATTLEIAEDVWVNRKPPVSREEQERNRKRLGV